MSQTFGTHGPISNHIGPRAERIFTAGLRAFGGRRGFHQLESAYARERIASLREKLRRGEKVYLLGIGPGSHNAGVALVEATAQSGIRLITNNEEERFTATKHFAGYPELGVEVLKEQMRLLGIEARDIHACLAGWDYIALGGLFARSFMQELPFSFNWLRKEDTPEAVNLGHVFEAFRAPARLGKQLGLPGPMPIIGLRHHDNHAWFSYGVSPFVNSEDPVMVAVLDSVGDDGGISLYQGKSGRLELTYSNRSLFDSLGMFYSIISSTQGGWTILSSEGRYMGATAWGNSDRLTNPYYRQLRQLFFFGSEGQVFLNRSMANWHHRLTSKPYTQALSEILGPPIPEDKMWNPDAVLNVEDVKHAEITRDRLDKAAATQLLFEDVLFHIVGHLIRTTGSNKLVFSGGTALNCIANMRMLEHFDEAYFERYTGRKNTRLHMWVPPMPGDAGIPMGAAYNFALSNGFPPGEPLRHAYYCGNAPLTSEIRGGLEEVAEIDSIAVGNVSTPGGRAEVADLLAFLISQNRIMGIFQGEAETGPRALGHRSILANPTNPKTREILNAQVKFREIIRPLAPMVTLEAARRWFVLEEGASDDDYNAYNYMVMTARARPEAREFIPAVIHHDQTGRIQIVREHLEPFIHAYLKAMGRRVGVEVSVNTSLNVGGPIVQTPKQALETLKRSKGMDGLLMIGADGEALLAWHNVVAAVKDAGARLRESLEAWRQERMEGGAAVAVG